MPVASLTTSARPSKQAEAKLSAAITEHNGVVQEADEFVRGVAQELDDAYDDKSETWKEGDAGQAAREFIDEWLNADLDDVSRPRVLMPDEPDFGDFELNLPEASE